MKEIHGDITSAVRGIICHQVNCKGAMGAGLALQIKQKFPKAYQDYMTAHRHGLLFLGNAIFSCIGKNIIIANLCGQDDYGRDKQYTDYDALKKALVQVQSLSLRVMMPAFIPKHMGCALAGGDWNIVKKLIESTVPDAIIVYYKK